MLKTVDCPEKQMVNEQVIAVISSDVTDNGLIREQLQR